MLADMLAAEGHCVTWWSSTFNHSMKRPRATVTTAVILSDRLKLILLHGVGYKTNVSGWRLANHAMIGFEFKRLASFCACPDIILCSFPTIELSLEAARYGKKHRVPVVIDVRDLWPDIFLTLLPRGFRWLGRLALLRLFRATEKALASATAIVGITPQFVAWGASKAGRVLRPQLDRAYPLAYSQNAPSADQQEHARKYWRELGVRENAFVVCFFGTMGRQFDLETVLDAARQLSRARDFQFILCGDGPSLDYYRSLAAGIESVIFPGWVGKVEIWTLMRMASIGLAPYKSELSFTLSIPNKAIEYLSAGLPVVTSLDGVLKSLVIDHDCGTYYANGDVGALVQALHSVHENEQTAERWSLNALALYNSKFKAEDIYKDMIAYLGRVLNQASQARHMRDE